MAEMGNKLGPRALVKAHFFPSILPLFLPAVSVLTSKVRNMPRRRKLRDDGGDGGTAVATRSIVGTHVNDDI